MDLPQEQRVEATIQSVPSPKVSVIVPVYKAEAYLNRCVDSLLAQTFEDFEILLIDDGSPDRSGEMCDEYARKDSRVRVIHKENGGVSSARQCGLDNARGEYVIHADPDDWTEPEMLEAMYRKAKEEDADMVICDYFLIRKNKSIYVRQSYSLDIKTRICDFFHHLDGVPWNKLVRRSCFGQYDISYPKEMSNNEDVFVNMCLIDKNLRLAKVDQTLYHYDQNINPNSLSSRSVEDLLKQDCLFYNLLKEKLSTNSFSQIELYLKLRLIGKSIIVGGDYLQGFSKNFSIVQQNLNISSISRRSRLLYWLAFHVSPYWAHRLHNLLSVIRKRLYTSK